MKTFLAKAKDGGIDFGEYNRYEFKKWLKENEGGLIRITCGGKKKVSETLRGYYYGAVIPTLKKAIPEWANESDETLHSLLKLEFNGVEIYSPFEKKKVRVSGTMMSKQASSYDAMMYIERIRSWLLENYGTDLPDAEEYKALRDRQFSEPVLEVEYPENTLGETKI